MATEDEVASACKDIREKYSACDVADAMLKLGVEQAGFLPDIAPLPRKSHADRLLAAPISTVLFVPKSHQGGVVLDEIEPANSNIPADKHWTDCPTPGTIVLMQQPQGQICALLGDLVASRLKYRGAAAAVIDGRVRDIASVGNINNNNSDFQVWSKGTSTVGTALEAKPWAVDVPLNIGSLTIYPGDILVADEAERGITVIPRSKLSEAMRLLPELKEADDNVLADVQKGVDLGEAFKRHRGHYTNSK